LNGSWRWVAWLVLGIGALILLGGLALGVGSLRLVLYGERSSGEVVEIRRDGDMYSPVVRFPLASGEMQEVTDLGSGAPDFAVGDRVPVLYMPENPESFRLATFDRLWTSALMVSIFGVAWLAFGVAAFALSRGVDVAVIGEGLFAAIAGVAAVIGTFVVWSALELYHSGVRTEGVVSEIRSGRYIDQEETELPSGRTIRRDVERTTYTPIVHFRTTEGREIEFFGRGGSGLDFAKGDRVTVVYDPVNPVRARIVSFVNFWSPSAAAWAVVLLFGGPVLLSRHMRRRVGEAKAP
jgi:hypothetical protein